MCEIFNGSHRLISSEIRGSDFTGYSPELRKDETTELAK
jgi:hypothetical protein